MKRALCWIRRDLRLHDHAALALATASAEKVAVVFVFDTNILDALEDRDDRRLTFIHRSLLEVDEGLRAKGSRLIVRHGDPTIEIPRLAAELGVEAVFAGRDYEPYARARDTAVGAAVRLETVKDTVIREGGEVLSSAGTPLRVYTPYSKLWRTALRESDVREAVADLTRLWPAAGLGAEEPWPLERFGFKEGSLTVKAGASGGERAVEVFSRKMDEYGKSRDFPARDGVSHLSVHLRFGTVSVRELVRLAMARGSAGADKWLAELIWREFYQDLLFHHPSVVDEPFQPQYAGIEYPGPGSISAEEAFEAWKWGQTGYPIVDAAMRCLAATGYLHNRLRMVVASFLTKDLLIDYRWGEAWFARQLLDFELASNNGGWQWSASVGADAQPYFRIFNPWLQSRKFDPEGAFIREWVPELAGLDDEAIHSPGDSGLFGLGGYPPPIVDHAVQRQQAVRLLEAAAKYNSGRA